MVHKIQRKEDEENIYLSKKNVDSINATPPRLCWVCKQLADNIRKKDNKYFIKKKNVIWDKSIKEHLKQLGW